MYYPLPSQKNSPPPPSGVALGGFPPWETKFHKTNCTKVTDSKLYIYNQVQPLFHSEPTPPVFRAINWRVENRSPYKRMACLFADCLGHLRSSCFERGVSHECLRWMESYPSTSSLIRVPKVTDVIDSDSSSPKGGGGHHKPPPLSLFSSIYLYSSGKPLIAQTCKYTRK